MTFCSSLIKRKPMAARLLSISPRVAVDTNAVPASRSQRMAHCVCRAEADSAEASTSAPSATAEKAAPAASPADDSWVPVMLPEDLPKGVRKEVSVGGSLVLIFWYRNQIYAISSRSPAEGAYSEGFIKAKFTQDYGIICPTTASVFSLKDGSVLEWYPDNPVLRAITPQTGNLPIYPVKLTQDAIMVSMDKAASRLAPTRGGADSSLESNNVFAIQPSVYVDESEAEASGNLSTAATLTVAITCFAIIATAGTATSLYYEDFVLLGGFWALMLTVGGFFAFQFSQSQEEEKSA